MGFDISLWYLLSFFLSHVFQVICFSLKVACINAVPKTNTRRNEEVARKTKQNRTFFSFSPEGNGSDKSRLQRRQPEEAVRFKPRYWAHEVLHLRNFWAAELPTFCRRDSSWEDRCSTQRGANKRCPTQEEGWYLLWGALASFLSEREAAMSNKFTMTFP